MYHKLTHQYTQNYGMMHVNVYFNNNSSGSGFSHKRSKQFINIIDTQVQLRVVTIDATNFGSILSDYIF